MEIGGAQMWLEGHAVGGYVGSQSLQYEAKTLFRHILERQNFCILFVFVTMISRPPFEERQ